MALMAMTTGAGGAWLACAIVIAIALLLTGSRGGIVAAIGGIITLALLLSVRRRPNSVALASGLSLAMLAIGVILFNLNDAIFRLVLPAAWGQNNHHLVDWDKTQNTYLALFQNLGIPFAAIFLTGLVFLAGRCAAAALTRERSAIAPLVASAAVLIVALHSLVNLSVQNSALSLMWAALLGAGVAQSWSSRVLTQR